VCAAKHGVTLLFCGRQRRRAKYVESLLRTVKALTVPMWRGECSVRERHKAVEIPLIQIKDWPTP
jgi:hypothetical protein